MGVHPVVTFVTTVPGRLEEMARRRAVGLQARWLAREEGQATAEYGLVIVAAAGVAAALIAFGRSGFQAFFTRVLEKIVSQVQ